jgi:hypothetical protein
MPIDIIHVLSAWFHSYQTSARISDHLEVNGLHARGESDDKYNKYPDEALIHIGAFRVHYRYGL